MMSLQRSNFQFPRINFWHQLRIALERGHYAWILLVAIVSYFWLPQLVNEKLALHQDSYLGISLVRLLDRALHGDVSLLWVSNIYGGHPLFAEGQGGFLNPLAVMSVLLFDTARAYIFFHGASAVLGGMGVYCLSRVLGLSRWAACFSSLAAALSGAWLYAHHNYPVTATIVWVPWLMAAVEYWIKRPSTIRGVFMACPAALLVFAGYPQVAYGAIIYIAASLIPLGFSTDSRKFILQHRWRFLASGLLAIILAVGLASVQLLPLVELARESHRSGGVDMPFAGFWDARFYVKGFLYFHFGDEPEAATLANLGNITVAMLAGLAICFRPNVRIIGHMIGAFLLLNLGMEHASPLFTFIYDNHILPGLHNYRIMHYFFAVSVVGFAVIAGYMLDRLAKLSIEKYKQAGTMRNFIYFLLIVTYFLGFGLLCKIGYVPVFGYSSFTTPALLIVAFALLGLAKKLKWLPLLAVGLLASEVLVWRSDFSKLHNSDALAKPDFLSPVLDDPQLGEYRVSNQTASLGRVGFISPLDPNIAPSYRRLLKSLDPFTGAQWGLSSIQGTTALSLARRSMLDPLLAAEMNGNEKAAPGMRIMDIYGVKYVSRDRPINHRSLTEVAYDPEQHIHIYRNDWARPRFQLYWNISGVESAEQALHKLRTASSRTLFVEARSPDNTTSFECHECDHTSEGHATIDIEKASDKLYQLRIETDTAAWLFLADAHYPGWRATVNGVSTPVHNGQVLGKAISLPPGSSEVVLKFRPTSFYLGLSLSFLSLATIAVLLVKNIRSPFYQPNRNL